MFQRWRRWSFQAVDKSTSIPWSFNGVLMDLTFLFVVIPNIFVSFLTCNSVVVFPFLPLHSFFPLHPLSRVSHMARRADNFFLWSCCSVDTISNFVDFASLDLYDDLWFLVSSSNNMSVREWCIRESLEWSLWTWFSITLWIVNMWCQ